MAMSKPAVSQSVAAKGSDQAKTKQAKEAAESKAKRAEQKAQERELDRELDDSFPASDPPSMTQPQRSGAPKQRKSVGSGKESRMAEAVSENTPPNPANDRGGKPDD